VPGERGTTAARSRIPGERTAAAAAMAVGCSGHLMVMVMVMVLKKGGRHTSVKEEQSMGRVLHGAGRAGAAAGGAAGDGCCGSSQHCGRCSCWVLCWEQDPGGQGWWGSSVVEVELHSCLWVDAWVGRSVLDLKRRRWGCHVHVDRGKYIYII